MAAQPLIPPTEFDNGSFPDSITWFEDSAFFVTEDGQRWRTDGESTTEVSSISINNRAYLNGQYFSINAGRLSTSDTIDGPTQPFLTSEGLEIEGVRTIRKTENLIYFITRQSALFPLDPPIYKLWRTDGTAEGTMVLHTSSTSFGLRENFGDQLAYVLGSSSGATNTLSLFTTTSTSSRLLARVSATGQSIGSIWIPGIPLIHEVVFAGNWYFTSSDGGLWRATTQSNPSPFPGSQPVKVQVDAEGVDNLTAVGNTAFYTKGDELWKVTGSTASLVRRIALSGGTQLSELTEFEGNLYFSARSFTGSTSLWVSNGTSTGQVKSFGSSDDLKGLLNMSVYNGHLYFSVSDAAHGRELWKTDGTTTQLVRDINVGPSGSSPGPVDPVGGLFQADDGILGSELWRTDGTTAGTTLVANINQEPFTFGPLDPYFSELNGEIFFQAPDGRDRIDLWRTNKSASSAESIAELISGLPLTSLPTLQLATSSDTLYFVATPEDSRFGNNSYLWYASDPFTTKSGVLQRTTNDPIAFPADLTIVGDSLYFTARSATHPSGRRIWWNRPDGSWVVNGNYLDPRFLTTAGAGYYFAEGDTGGLWRGLGLGATKIADVTPVGHGVVVNGVYYFAGWTSETGVELWRTNGSTAGTVVVKEITPGMDGSNVHSLANVNGTLYFVADHDGDAALWKSNGTASGTALVRDIPGNDRLSHYGSLTNVNGALYFAADDGVHGTELWASDEPADGAAMVLDIWTGSGSSIPQYLFASGENLYFIANDGIHGYLPLVLSLTDDGADAGGPYFTYEGQTITFDASGSSPEATLFEWDLDGNGSFETVGKSVSFFAEDSGVHTATLRVTGPAGTAFDTATIEVENLPPVARVNGVLAGFTDLSSHLRLWADDPSPVDQTAGFDFEVDYDGDGAVDDVVSGPSGTLVSHVFNTSGVHHVQVTAVDKDGGRSNTASHRVVIIDAVRDADAEQPGLTNLVWTGTNGDDHVVFTQMAATTILIEIHQLDGVPLSPSFRAYMFGINGQVIADGLAGNDVIDLSGVNTISSQIFGGLGQDTIFGSQADDLIYSDDPQSFNADGAEGDGGEGRPGDHVYAGGGDDRIYGSTARDYLDGGAGHNQFQIGRDGAEGRDTLVGTASPDSSTSGALSSSSRSSAATDELALLDEAWSGWDDALGGEESLLMA